MKSERAFKGGREEMGRHGDSRTTGEGVIKEDKGKTGEGVCCHRDKGREAKYTSI